VNVGGGRQFFTRNIRSTVVTSLTRASARCAALGPRPDHDIVRRDEGLQIGIPSSEYGVRQGASVEFSRGPQRTSSCECHYTHIAPSLMPGAYNAASVVVDQDGELALSAGRKGREEEQGGGGGKGEEGEGKRRRRRTEGV